jgi:arylsulfatase A-like enzyme
LRLLLQSCCVVLALVQGVSNLARSQAAAPPNIVMILADDLSWVDTSVQMHPTNPDSKSDFHQTPRLEQLAAQGMRFSNAYSAAMVCAPTRASLLTGQSPARLQMTDVFEKAGGPLRWPHYVQLPLIPPVSEAINPNILTLPQLVKQSNPDYVTGLYGKWHLESADPGTKPINMGYDFADTLTPLQSNPNVDPWDLFEMAGKANAFMQQQVANDKPFYLTVTPYAVHAPIKSRDVIEDKYRALPPGTKHTSVEYAAMTEDLDTSIGMILDKIQDLGIADNTYILFASDNGGASNFTSNKPLARGKAELWEGGIRVPMIVKGPGIAANTFSQVPATTVDLFSTIADLAGHAGPLPELVEGASLAPVLNNGGELPDGMEHLSRHFHEGGEIYWHSPYNFGAGVNYRIRPSSAVRDGDYKLLVFYGEHGQPDEELLFNLTTNISETSNLASSMPEKRAELRAKLDNYLIAIDASFAYDVKVPVTMNWDAGQIGNVPDGWRSTVDLKYKGRETWTEGGGTEAPQLVSTSAYQPGLAKEAFHFDGNDVMRRNYFQVGDVGPRRTTKPTAGTGDYNRSASMEFWVKLDSMSQNQVLFETGEASKGLSLTLGDSDADGLKNDLRLRLVGLTGADQGGAGITKELVLTTKIDRFANPIADFVHLAAVFNDDPVNRYAEIYVNGALAGRVNGLAGTTESLFWDGYDGAGLGNTGGSALGASGGSGALPFSGGGFRGSMSLVRFNNYAVDAAAVLERYNSNLSPVSFGIASVAGDVEVPEFRPGNVSLNAAESSILNVVHERNDVLDQSLAVDALIDGATTLALGNLPMTELLSAGTEYSSYLLQFDPATNTSSFEDILGSVNFRGEILAVLWKPTSLAATDAVLGSIGDYGSTADRGLDFSTAGSLSISANQHTLGFDLQTLANEMLQFRVLTTTVNGPDFNADGIIDNLDLQVWQSSFGLNANGDADGDGDTDGRDFLAWQREYLQPIGGSSTSESLLAQWQQAYGADAGGDFDDDGDTDGRDLLVWQRDNGAGLVSSSAAVPEPGTFLLALAVMGGFVSSRRTIALNTTSR